MVRRTRARNALGIVGREGHLKLEPLGLWRGGVAGKKRVILAVCVEEEAFAYAFEEGRVLTYDRGWRFEFGEKDILGLSLEACLPFGRRLELGAGWRGGQSPRASRARALPQPPACPCRARGSFAWGAAAANGRVWPGMPGAGLDPPGRGAAAAAAAGGATWVRL